jgi:hypothetical protein
MMSFFLAVVAPFLGFVFLEVAVPFSRFRFAMIYDC